MFVFCGLGGFLVEGDCLLCFFGNGLEVMFMGGFYDRCVRLVGWDGW